MGFAEEEVDAVVQKAFKHFQQRLNEDYKHIETKGNISVYMKQEGTDPYIVKGIGLLDHPVLEILDVINPKHSCEAAAKFIPKITERNHLVSEVYSAGVFMVSDRDFIKACDVIKGEQEGEYYWINGNMENHPEQSGYVRGKNPILSWHFKENDKKQTQVTMIIQTEFGGYIPQYLIDQSVLAAPYTFNSISNVIKNKK